MKTPDNEYENNVNNDINSNSNSSSNNSNNNSSSNSSNSNNTSNDPAGSSYLHVQNERKHHKHKHNRKNIQLFGIPENNEEESKKRHKKHKKQKGQRSGTLLFASQDEIDERDALKAEEKNKKHKKHKKHRENIQMFSGEQIDGEQIGGEQTGIEIDSDVNNGDERRRRKHVRRVASFSDTYSNVSKKPGALKKLARKLDHGIDKTEDNMKKFKAFLIRKGLLTNENMVPTFITLLITIALIFTLIMLLDNTLTYANQAQKEIAKNGDLKNQIAQNKEKIANGNFDGKDAYVEKKIFGLLPMEEITKLTRDYWSYQLVIDNTPVTSDAAPISVNAGTLTITMTQSEKERVLPVNIHAMGSVTAGDKNDNFADHIIFDPSVNYNLTNDKKDNVSTAVYTVNAVKSGQNIVLTLSEPLAKRLNLTSTTLTIAVK